VSIEATVSLGTNVREFGLLRGFLTFCPVLLFDVLLFNRIVQKMTNLDFGEYRNRTL